MLCAVMFPEPAILGFAVVDILVRFFAFNLPFELLFLMIVLVVGRFMVLFFGSNVVFEVVEVVSVLIVVVLLEVVPVLEVVRDKGGSVIIGWIMAENMVVASSIRVSTTSGSAMFVRPGVGGVVSSSTFSLLPSSGVKVTKG